MFKELEDISKYKKINVLNTFGENLEIDVKDIKNVSFENKSLFFRGETYIKMVIVIEGELHYSINSYYDSTFYCFGFDDDGEPRIDTIYIYTENEKYIITVIDTYTAYTDNLPFPRINILVDDDGIPTDDYVLNIWVNITKETI